MTELEICPYCKTLPTKRTAGKMRPKHYVVCLNNDCMVNPCTELFEHEEDAVRTWNECKSVIISDAKLNEIYEAVERCENYRAELSSDMARVKAENETYHFIFDVLGIRRN